MLNRIARRCLIQLARMFKAVGAAFNRVGDFHYKLSAKFVLKALRMEPYKPFTGWELPPRGRKKRRK